MDGLGRMWPPAVEAVAAVFRNAGMEARLEELPEGERSLPGTGVRVDAIDCDGRPIVALVPVDREIDQRRLAEAVGCRLPRPASPPPFPYRGVTVLIERLLLGEGTVWIEAGSAPPAPGVFPSPPPRAPGGKTGGLLPG